LFCLFFFFFFFLKFLMFKKINDDPKHQSTTYRLADLDVDWLLRAKLVGILLRHSKSLLFKPFLRRTLDGQDSGLLYTTDNTKRNQMVNTATLSVVLHFLFSLSEHSQEREVLFGQQQQQHPGICKLCLAACCQWRSFLSFRFTSRSLISQLQNADKSSPNHKKSRKK
jgi:hypothetical protein